MEQIQITATKTPKQIEITNSNGEPIGFLGVATYETADCGECLDLQIVGAYNDLNNDVPAPIQMLFFQL